jgi:hypothetical protein
METYRWWKVGSGLDDYRSYGQIIGSKFYTEYYTWEFYLNGGR